MQWLECAVQQPDRSASSRNATPAAETYTGAAYIFIDDATGDNAIIISPGNHHAGLFSNNDTLADNLAAADKASADAPANRMTDMVSPGDSGTGCKAKVTIRASGIRARSTTSKVIAFCPNVRDLTKFNTLKPNPVAPPRGTA